MNGNENCNDRGPRIGSEPTINCHWAATRLRAVVAAALGETGGGQ